MIFLGIHVFLNLQPKTRKFPAKSCNYYFFWAVSFSHVICKFYECQMYKLRMSDVKVTNIWAVNVANVWSVKVTNILWVQLAVPKSTNGLQLILGHKYKPERLWLKHSHCRAVKWGIRRYDLLLFLYVF